MVVAAGDRGEGGVASSESVRVRPAAASVHVEAWVKEVNGVLGGRPFN